MGEGAVGDANPDEKSQKFFFDGEKIFKLARTKGKFSVRKEKKNTTGIDARFGPGGPSHN